MVSKYVLSSPSPSPPTSAEAEAGPDVCPLFTKHPSAVGPLGEYRCPEGEDLRNQNKQSNFLAASSLAIVASIFTPVIWFYMRHFTGTDKG